MLTYYIVDFSLFLYFLWMASLSQQTILFQCNACSIQALVNQIVARFKAEFAPQLNEILLPLVQAIFQMLGAKVDPTDVEETTQYVAAPRGMLPTWDCPREVCSTRDAHHGRRSTQAAPQSGRSSFFSILTYAQY